MKNVILSLKEVNRVSRDELKKINGGAMNTCRRMVCGISEAQCNAYPLMIYYNATKGCCSIENPGC